MKIVKFAYKGRPFFNVLSKSHLYIDVNNVILQIHIRFYIYTHIFIYNYTLKVQMS